MWLFRSGNPSSGPPGIRPAAPSAPPSAPPSRAAAPALPAAGAIVCLACLAGLGGCATPQEQSARMQAQVEHMMAVYGPACTRLGYAAGSDGWRSCVLQLSTKDDLQRYGTYGPGGWYGPFDPYWPYGPGRWRGWAP